MVNKIAFIAVIAFIWIYASIWLFNHFNAWAGFALFGVGLLIVANKVQKLFKNNQ